VNKALEAARAEKTIGKSLEANLVLHLTAEQAAVKAEDLDFLADLFIVSKVTVGEDTQGETALVDVAPAAGEKCQRCWKFHEEVGEDGLCPRCHDVVAKM